MDVLEEDPRACLARVADGALDVVEALRPDGERREALDLGGSGQRGHLPARVVPGHRAQHQRGPGACRLCCVREVGLALLEEAVPEHGVQEAVHREHKAVGAHHADEEEGEERRPHLRLAGAAGEGPRGGLALGAGEAEVAEPLVGVLGHVGVEACEGCGDGVCEGGDHAPLGV